MRCEAAGWGGGGLGFFVLDYDNSYHFSSKFPKRAILYLTRSGSLVAFGMKITSERLLLFLAWPVLAPCVLVIVAACLVAAWPIILTRHMCLDSDD